MLAISYPDSRGFSPDLQTQSNVPISIRIILLEHIRHPLQTDACLHKQIKGQDFLPFMLISSPTTVRFRIRAEEQCHELR